MRAAQRAEPLEEVVSVVVAVVLVFVWGAEGAANVGLVAGSEEVVVEVVEVGKAAAAGGELVRVVGIVEAAQVEFVGLGWARNMVEVSADYRRSEERTVGCDSTHCGSAESMRHWCTAGVRQHYLYIGANCAHIGVSHWCTGSHHSYTEVDRWYIAAHRCRGVVMAVGRCRHAPEGTSLDMSLHSRVGLAM